MEDNHYICIDENIAFEMLDSVRDSRYTLMEAEYDFSDIYDYIFENTHALPVIDTNRRRGIIEDRLTYNLSSTLNFILFSVCSSNPDI